MPLNEAVAMLRQAQQDGLDGVARFKAGQLAFAVQ
jgi:hypothetical protein